ncbi:MAG: hypothetical protein ACK5MV_06090 [Aminipila sp.]
METKNENLRTIHSTICDKGFKYHMLKGRLLKGSTISKNLHPVTEVVLFRQCLIRSKRLKDYGDFWVLKDSITIGLLMALNLHYGEPVPENPLNQTIVVGSDDAQKLEDKLPVKGLKVSDSDIVKKMDCDALKLSNVYTLQISKSFLTYHGSNSFGPDEKFVLSIMQQEGIISQCARHGDAGCKEADIVDKLYDTQYEIIYEFKNSLRSKKMDKVAYDPQMFLTQLVDNAYIHSSNALIEKFVKKKYTDKYRKRLVVFNVGSFETMKTMLSSMANRLKPESYIKNDFENLYIISYDFISEIIHFFQLKPYHYCSFPCNNQDIGFVNMTTYDYANLNNKDSYLMICRNIFNNQETIRYGIGQELIEWVKEMRIAT